MAPAVVGVSLTSEAWLVIVKCLYMYLYIMFLYFLVVYIYVYVVIFILIYIYIYIHFLLHSGMPLIERFSMRSDKCVVFNNVCT
jgi:hypothetical protein